jgi:hypothetical protein
MEHAEIARLRGVGLLGSPVPPENIRYPLSDDKTLHAVHDRQPAQHISNGVTGTVVFFSQE